MFSLWRHRLQARAEALRLLRQNVDNDDDAQIDDMMQRLGQPALARPPGELLWVHMGQGANAEAIVLLLKRLREDRGPFGVLMTGDLPPGAPPWADAICQATPADTDEAVQGFLDHWHPDACLWAGGGWAPVLLSQAAGRGVPAFCVDARPTEPTARPSRWRSGVHRAALGGFQRIFTGSQKDAAQLLTLGARSDQVDARGLLEASAGALPCNESEWGNFGDLLEARPLWLAVDVAVGEFSALAEAHRRASRLSHRLLLILVPNDPKAGPALRTQLESQGWRTALRSVDEEPAEDTQIYVADTEGELGLWYRLAPITFMGQTLYGAAPGRPPGEPAALGSVVVTGPRDSGHGDAYARLRRAGALCAIDSPKTLGRTIERLLAPDKAAELAGAAWGEITAGAEVSDRVLALLNAALNGEDP